MRPNCHSVIISWDSFDKGHAKEFKSKKVLAYATNKSFLHATRIEFGTSIASDFWAMPSDSPEAAWRHDMTRWCPTLLVFNALLLARFMPKLRQVCQPPIITALDLPALRSVELTRLSISIGLAALPVRAFQAIISQSFGKVTCSHQRMACIRLRRTVMMASR